MKLFITLVLKTKPVLTTVCVLMLVTPALLYKPKTIRAAHFRPPVDLSGLWKSDDGGIYYVRQDRKEIFWAGLSEDSGRTYTNVFGGVWRPNESPEEPADYGVVVGEWADVPRGKSMGQGTLRLSFRFSGELEKETETGGFGSSKWVRIDNSSITQAEALREFTPSFPNELTGLWISDLDGTYYVRQTGNTDWWLGLAVPPKFPSQLDANIYKGTIQGNTLKGTVIAIPWLTSGGAQYYTLTLTGDRGSNSTTLTAVEKDRPVGHSWKKPVFGHPPR